MTTSPAYLPFSLTSYLQNRPLPDTPELRHALASWRQARQTFNHLLSSAPSARQVINDLLQRALAIDPERTGLRVDDGNSPFVSLTQLCLWAHNHPSIPDNLDGRTTVQGKPGATSPEIQLKPSELYIRLAAQNLPTELGKRWRDYWEQRAAGTALSRLEHAREQYRLHFMAALDIALGHNQLKDGEERPVSGLRENPEWLVYQGKAVQLEIPSCLPGTLVISLEGEPIQVLYNPAQSQAFTAYATRQALQARLATQEEEPITYKAVDSVGMGSSPLFEQLGTLLFDTLKFAPARTFEQHAAQSLTQADQLTMSWRDSAVFAQAPEDGICFDLEDTRSSLYDFGNLGLDLAPDLRKQLITHQLALLEAVPDDKLTECKQLQKALQGARSAAQERVSAVTSSAKWHSDANPVTADPLLIQGHRDGLLAHARLQRLLGQLDDGHLSWVESVLKDDTREALVAQIELLPTTSENTVEQNLKTILPGALAIMAKLTPDSPESTHGLLLYWIGQHGGLLKCDSRHQLEQCLGDHSIQLSVISGDPIGHALTGLLEASRQEARALQAINTDTFVAALPRLREELSLRLQLPDNAARAVAQGLLDERAHLITQAGASYNRLRNLLASERTALRTLVDDYATALRKALALILSELPERRSFCLQRLNKRLRKDFDGFKDHALKIDLPLNVSWSNRDLVSEGGTPGTPLKKFPSLSVERETLALETALLEHIDDAMFERLAFMRLQVETTNSELRQALANRIDRAYLRTLATELNLAGSYEQAIISTFSGINDSDFMHAYRRECLIEPHRLLLKLQNLLFHASGHLDSTSHAMFAQVIDASSKDDYRKHNRDLRLLPARLTSGGPDTDDQPTGLAGVTFIEDRISQVTLLYRPDHPKAPLLQFPDLESARLSLFDSTVDSRERDYVASRALQGKPAAHRSRLDQAHRNSFNGIIGIGSQWPATTSLAQLQLDTHMGQLLQAHRNTSRSNLDLYFENLAAQAGKVFIGFRIVLGMIPVVGLPISLYDLYNAANELVEAISEGGTVEILDAIQNVLTSVIDIAMDQLGGGAGINAAGLRRSARQRQLNRLAQANTILPRVPLKERERLTGLAHYQTTEPVSLDGLSIASEGRYRGIYRHSQGNYIQAQGRQYRVQWDSTSHTWELSGNGNTFRRAIALDERGNWDSHFALYGVHRQGAGAGGGQALGRLADTLDPLWPAAVRERLPRWWRDQVYRRHKRLKGRIVTDMHTLRARNEALNQRLTASHNASDPTLTADLQTSIADAKRIHADCLAFAEISSGRNRAQARSQANDLAAVICDAHFRLKEYAQRRMTQHADEVDAVMGSIQTKRATVLAITDKARFMNGFRELMELDEQLVTARGKMLTETDELRQQVDAMRTWRKRAGSLPERRDLLARIDSELERFGDRDLDFMTLTPLTGILIKPTRSPTRDWLNLQRLMAEPRAELDRALHNLYELPHVGRTPKQHHALLTKSLEHIQTFRKRLRYWQTSYAGHFDANAAERLDATLESYMQPFKGMQQATQKPIPAIRPKQSRPRVFETVENHYLIGEPDLQDSNVYRISGINGRTEIYRQDPSGKFTLTNPDTNPYAAPRASLKELQGNATRQLEQLSEFTGKVRQYAVQGMEAASLEDLMGFKAADLDDLHRRIAQRAPSDPLLVQLSAASQQLSRQGRQLRIEQIVQSSEPNGGHLEYLVQQDVVSIEKVAALVELRRTPEGRQDFLQEFLVRDKRQRPPQPLWYAHVHFNKQAPAFDDFVKAHLKTPAQRHLGREWQASHVEAIWRGDLSRSVAETHLSPLF